MVWTIPLADVAGVLAVTFTSGTPAMLAPPVQRPGRTAPELPPPVEPSPSEAAPDDAAPVDAPPVEPTPPLLPPADAASDSTVPVAPLEEPEHDPPEVADDETPVPAPAVRERLLRPNTRRRFFSMSAGGATTTGYAAYYSRGGMDFQMEAIIGSHTRRFPNFGGGFVVQFRKGFTTEMSFAGRLLWDKPLSKSFAIYSSADFTFGLNVPIGIGGYLYPGIPSALIGIGWGAKMIVAERLMVFFRPIGPNLVAPSFGNQLYATFRWDVAGGLGVVW